MRAGTGHPCGAGRQGPAADRTAGGRRRSQPAGLVSRGAGPLLELADRYPDAPGAAGRRRDWLARLRPRLGGTCLASRAAFDDAIADQIEALAQSSVELPGGVAPAHSSDAGAGGDRRGLRGARSPSRQGKTAAHLAVNRAVLPALARQIRLRNLSGAILVDFAGLPPRRRAALAPVLAGRAGGRSAAPAAARLHRAWLGGDRAAARPSAVARTARRTACRRPGGAAPHRGRSGRAPASIAGAARVACGRRGAARRMPWRCRTLRGGSDGRLILRADPSLPATEWIDRGERCARSERAPTCPICGKPSGADAAAVLQPALRRHRSGAVADRAVPHSRSDADESRRCETGGARA